MVYPCRAFGIVTNPVVFYVALAFAVDVMPANFRARNQVEHDGREVKTVVLVDLTGLHAKFG